MLKWLILGGIYEVRVLPNKDLGNLKMNVDQSSGAKITA